MPGQERRVIAKGTQPRPQPCFTADKIVTMRGHNKIAASRNGLRPQAARWDDWQAFIERPNVQLVELPGVL